MLVKRCILHPHVNAVLCKICIFLCSLIPGPSPSIAILSLSFDPRNIRREKKAWMISSCDACPCLRHNAYCIQDLFHNYHAHMMRSSRCCKGQARIGLKNHRGGRRPGNEAMPMCITTYLWRNRMSIMCEDYCTEGRRAWERGYLYLQVYFSMLAGAPCHTSLSEYSTHVVFRV